MFNYVCISVRIYVLYTVGHSSLFKYSNLQCNQIKHVQCNCLGKFTNEPSSVYGICMKETLASCKGHLG